MKAWRLSERGGSGWRVAGGGRLGKVGGDTLYGLSTSSSRERLAYAYLVGPETTLKLVNLFISLVWGLKEVLKPPWVP